MTLDNATANDTAIKSLKGRIEDWKGGLDEQIEPISHIRSAIKYVRSSSSRFATLKSVVEKVKIDTRGLVSMDVETRWNLTYTMLDKTLKFEKAFARIGASVVFRWGFGRGFVGWLFGGRRTGGLVVWWSFAGCFSLGDGGRFHGCLNDSDGGWSFGGCFGGVSPENGENEWRLLELDLGYKMQYVEYILSIAYGSLMGRLKSQDVRDVLNLLYNHYNCSCSKDPNENIENDDCVMGESSDLLQSQWEKHMNKEGFVVKKYNLEIYLKDDVVKINDFNILSWWKVSSCRYPIVAKIARDILSIPISTVASESAFSTGDRILDSYRSSLPPKTVEELICTQQWLRSPFKECKLEDILEEVQKIDEIEEVLSEYPDSPLRIDEPVDMQVMVFGKYV
ncbi:hypothetical protein KY290_003556 [Solanum tuberosum]|uniref:HAT C-terminal dimerisation domain-containing protein n=1 Tax=Solanum tuberosum TaxID=4113 RepID=A0ABQ7WV90_SOLTU|nr:hypothetical protein KY285_003386 [Solanum tuberosum]KAH0783958.1 hypothetical protein KY290_003556 [Solanum tuberosum]